MAAEIGDLAVRVGADITGLKMGMNDASRAVGIFSTDAAKKLSSFSANIAKVGAAAAAAGTLAIGALVKGSIDGADALSKLSKSVGVSTEKLSALQYAAGLSGVKSDELSSALLKLSKNSRDTFLGVGSAKDAFESLGISVQNASGQLKSNDQILAEVVDKFSQMPDGVGKTALAMDIFGRSGARLIPMLNEGTSGLSAMSEEAARLGLIVSGDTAKQSEIFNDSLDKMQKAMQGLGLRIAEEALPALNDFTKSVNDPATQQGLADIAIAIIKIGESAVKVLSQISGFAKFIAEEIAATINGINPEDIVRLEDKLASLEARKSLAKGKINKQTQEEIDKTKELISAYYEMQRAMPQPLEKKQEAQSVSSASTSSATGVDPTIAKKQSDELLAQNEKEIGAMLRKEGEQMRIAEQEDARRQAQLESIKQRYLTEEELDLQHKETMMLIGEEYDATKFETEAQWRSVREQAEAEHLARITELNRSAYDGIQGLIETRWGKAAASTAGSFKSILGTMATGSRKAFEISKAWALGDAVVSTAQGIAKGVAAGYPAAIPLVAAAAATGFAQISAIKNQKFGGAGGAAAAGNGAPATAPNPIGVGGGSGGASSSSTLTVAPINPNAIFSGSAMIGFGQQIYDFTKDGGKVVFSA